MSKRRSRRYLNGIQQSSAYNWHAQVINKLLHKCDPHGRVIEVGVAYGWFASYVLKENPHISYVMVDPWVAYLHIYKTQQKADEAMAEAIKNTQFAADRITIVRQTSLEAANGFVDASADLVFVDGYHSYEALSADLRAWHRVVKPGGYLSAHDYGNRLDRGKLTQACDDFAAEFGYTDRVGHSRRGRVWYVKVGHGTS